DIDASRLTLELLETQEFEADSQEGAIEALSRLGVKLAIDDLGSGYNSLKRLAELPFDTIKVDQSLTLNLRRSPMLSFSLVSTLLKLGRDLGRQVIIEGAQDTDTVQAVFALGATLAQGFALARPMPAAQFQAWCAARRDVADACGVSGPLGALALHWALAHGGAAHVGVAQDGPVARWLRDCGATAEVLGWHEQLHLDPASWSHDQPFVAWLLRELRARP
ncbi:EAL domain-containing protein, partial [Metallibacterium scheffleri]|uniref:EAL domain-containing protein n=1 Tax=Metallibacterium scheffleri TaxID=993689 RepID=UPI0026ECDEC3